MRTKQDISDFIQNEKVTKKQIVEYIHKIYVGYIELETTNKELSTELATCKASLRECKESFSALQWKLEKAANKIIKKVNSLRIE